MFTFFTPLIFVCLFIQNLLGFTSLSVKNESMSFFFLDALGDIGEYLKKKYIGRGMRKEFKEQKAEGKRIILFPPCCPALFSNFCDRATEVGGLWKLWCLMLKLCSKQSLPSPVWGTGLIKPCWSQWKGFHWRQWALAQMLKALSSFSGWSSWYQFSHQTLWQKRRENPVPAG